jgi:hypothetical protein
MKVAIFTSEISRWAIELCEDVDALRCSIALSDREVEHALHDAEIMVLTNSVCTAELSAALRFQLMKERDGTGSGIDVVDGPQSISSAEHERMPSGATQPPAKWCAPHVVDGKVIKNLSRGRTRKVGDHGLPQDKCPSIEATSIAVRSNSYSPFAEGRNDRIFTSADRPRADCKGRSFSPSANRPRHATTR